MKRIRISPAAEAALADILEYTVERWGPAQGERYKDQLLGRVLSVARGELPRPKPCEILMQSKRSAAGLCYCREGRHFIILRESSKYIEVVEFIHQSRDLDRLIDVLSGQSRKRRPSQ